MRENDSQTTRRASLHVKQRGVTAHAKVDADMTPESWRAYLAGLYADERDGRKLVNVDATGMETAQATYLLECDDVSGECVVA
jgi:hypothetical protein